MAMRTSKSKFMHPDFQIQKQQADKQSISGIYIKWCVQCICNMHSSERNCACIFANKQHVCKRKRTKP